MLRFKIETYLNQGVTCFVLTLPHLTSSFHLVLRLFSNRELKQSRRRRQQKPHKFAYLTMKNSVFAPFARVFFIF